MRERCARAYRFALPYSCSLSSVVGTNTTHTPLLLPYLQAVEQNDAEVERLGSGKGKKNNKKAIETLNQHIANHKAHIAKLETVNRLVANDSLEPEVVDEVKEDLDFYLEAYLEDPEFLDSYDEDYYYDR